MNCQAKIDAIREQHELDDTEDEDVEAAGNALLAIHGALEETSAPLRRVRMS
jgi:hypothetical protein